MITSQSGLCPCGIDPGAGWGGREEKEKELESQFTVLINSLQIQPGDFFFFLEEHMNEESEVNLSYFQSAFVKGKLFYRWSEG